LPRDNNKNAMFHDDDVLAEVQGAPIVSRQSIAALERSIALAKTPATTEFDRRARKHSRTDLGEIDPAAFAERAETHPLPHALDLNEDSPLEGGSDESANDEPGVDDADQLVPRSPCARRPLSMSSRSSFAHEDATPEDDAHEDVAPEDDAGRVDPALAALVHSLGDTGGGIMPRQQAAHTLARQMAQVPSPWGASEIERCSPLGPLLELATDDDSSLTMQLVLSCLTNLATLSSRLLAETTGVAELLLRALQGGEADAGMRSYSLVTAYNLSNEESVMSHLERAGAAAVVRALAPHCSGDGAKHATEVLRALKRAAPKRPSSAARVISRVSSFSRGRGRQE